MKRLLLTIAIALAIAPASAQAAYPALGNFGINHFDVTFANEDGTNAPAGSHPFAVGTTFLANLDGEEAPEGWLKDLILNVPPGLVGDITFPRCSSADFAKSSGNVPACPLETAVGVTAIGINDPGAVLTEPVYNLTPPPGVVLRLGFRAEVLNVIIDATLSPEPPYHAVVAVRNTAQLVPVFGAKTQLWGDPSSPAHDILRGVCGNISLPSGPLQDVDFEAISLERLEHQENSCPVAPRSRPFFTLPTNCGQPLLSSYEALSWEGEEDSGSIVTHDASGSPVPLSGCAKLGFKPSISSKPTTESAETGSGLDFSVDFSDEGLTSVGGLAQSNVKSGEITFPEGLTINPSVGEGLGVCTPAQLDRETLASAPGEGCPSSSKLGTVLTTTPLITEPVEGSIYLAQQDDRTTATPGAENPFDSLIALYMILKNPKLGVILKLAVKVEPNPQTGELVATLKDSPQLPFSHFSAHLRTGARAALITPPACGTYTTEAKLTPWANPSNPLTVAATFKLSSGVGAGPCPPTGVPPFKPTYQAGSLNNNAASHTPFYMRLIRRDGEQNMTKFSSALPPGVLGSLVGVAKCPDSAIAIAKAKTGHQEIAAPSCPANSLIGHTLAGAGVGDALTYVGGQLYLGGPYKGDPLSVISVTPAVAGPFDADTVVVRLGLTLNPKTAEVEVDGATSDPIPHILKGIVLKVRDLRVYVDRPNFILNPTSCDESSARATLFGSYLNVLDPSDDKPVDLSSRFQAANCLNLGFKPHLGLRLTGGTKRGGHPGLTATYKPRKGDANLEGLVTRLPRSAFLDQAHIRTICTRVQFAEDNCPKAAQYGYIKAWTPLLDEPLQGPVWLRSSNHKLPDLVFDLHGLVDVEVATRIDSQRGGIRAIVEDAPDAPLSKVELRMQGAKKGLIINSRNLCGAISKASVEFEGHNGKRSKAKPVMQADCGGKRRGRGGPQ